MRKTIIVLMLILIMGVMSVSAQVCENADIILVMDRTGSMGEPNDNQPLDLAKSAANNFVDLLVNDEHTGLVSFADSANFDLGLTPTPPNNALVQTAISGLTPAGQTCIGCGIEAARFMFSDDVNNRPEAPDVMILLSDGYPNVNPVGPDSDADVYTLERADAAKADGIIIYAIGIGEANGDLMSQIASNPNTPFFSFGTPEDLESIYEQIQGSICEGEDPFCGDRNLDNNEECDDGNLNNGDGCNQYCELEYCSNDRVDQGEVCDGSDDDACPGLCNDNCECDDVPPPTDIPEFGILTAGGVLVLAGLFIHRKRQH